jgi:type II secretory pathway pseudopilin PulG
MSWWRSPAGLRLGREDGYVLPMVLIVLMIVGIMGAALLTAIMINQQHVSRDRAYSQGLAVAEAGLNQYLWTVYDGKSSETNDFAIPNNPEADVHKQTVSLADPDGVLKGTYTILVTPPDDEDSRITVTVTGSAAGTDDVDRTVTAHIGRPAFSEYVLLVDEQVYIGGPLTRKWHGKTHSNEGIRIETADINDMITCAQEEYNYSGATKDGIWSQNVPADDPSRSYWSFPVPAVDFTKVTSDFVRLNSKATHSGVDNLPYVTPSPSTAAHGWYIELLENERYRIAQVSAEYENKTYSSGSNYGGYLTYGSFSGPYDYPDNGVIYVNDNVWVQGTHLSGRITIACSGQLNPSGKTAATSINVVGSITYEEYDGTVAVGLIAQNNVKIPMYAPMGIGSSGKGTDLDNPGSISMEIDAALIAQEGAEYVSRDSSGSPWGPRRNLLTFYGSVSSHDTPTRATTSGTTYCGFAQGANEYDPFLLHNPPPFFPTIGSYQILDWQELPDSQAVDAG